MISKNNDLVIYRLTALWAFVEAGLGGFLHAFKSPFTGLILGAIAMTIITLICYYAERIWLTILKSLTVVLIIKMVISPHSMISAYVAVSFQGLLGGILYSLFGVRQLTIILLAISGMIESALQKILVLTILFGKSIWEAIDTLGNWIGQKFGFLLSVESSTILIGSYVLFYFFAGVILSYYIISLLQRIKSVPFDINYSSIKTDGFSETYRKNKKTGIQFFKIIFVLFSVALIIGLILTSLNNEQWSTGIYVLVRTSIILIIWYGLLAPFLIKNLKKYLNNKKSGVSNQVGKTLDLFPYLSSIVQFAWQKNLHLPFLSRIKEFIFTTLMFTIHFEKPKT